MSDTGFSMSASDVGRLPDQYMPDVQTGQLQVYVAPSAEVWTKPPVFPSGAGGLLSTVDDYLAFARLLLNRGIDKGRRLLSERSVELMTTNHLTLEQIAGGGPILHGEGWGFGMAVSVKPDEISPSPGRYGWAGGYGTTWFNDPHRNLVAMAMTQAADFLFNGSADEFSRLAAGAVSSP
jgi:CubicO group peptidase (beta-lactamase class C family)